VKAAVQDAEGGVVGASDDDKLVIGQNGFVHPDEQSMFCHYGRSSETRQRYERATHFRYRLRHEPPSLPIALALVLVAQWFDVAGNVGERCFK